MFGRKLVVSTFWVLITLSTACMVPIQETGASQDTLFQTSTLSKLSAGDFDGNLTIGELKRHGNFGLGTYNALDGEMVILEGQVYQIREDGIANSAEDTMQTPFAAVTYFDADQTLTVSERVDCPKLQAQIDSELSTLDMPYAVKVSGQFMALKVRAPHKQSEPYPTLTDALVDQVLFESQNISGTMVGFRLPDYLANSNSAGYHFHFIAHDKQHGGHVLECEGNALTVEIDTIAQIYIDLDISEAQ